MKAFAQSVNESEIPKLEDFLNGSAGVQKLNRLQLIKAVLMLHAVLYNQGMTSKRINVLGFLHTGEIKLRHLISVQVARLQTISDRLPVQA